MSSGLSRSTTRARCASSTAGSRECPGRRRSAGHNSCKSATSSMSVSAAGPIHLAFGSVADQTRLHLSLVSKRAVAVDPGSWPSWEWSPKLWRGRTTHPEVLATAGDASKATAGVACGCELCFDRLPRAVGSGEGAGSVGRATDAVGYEDLRVLSVWGPDKHHAEMDQRDKRRQDRRLLAPVDGCGARENPGGLVLE